MVCPSGELEIVTSLMISSLTSFFKVQAQRPFFDIFSFSSSCCGVPMLSAYFNRKWPISPDSLISVMASFQQTPLMMQSFFWWQHIDLWLVQTIGICCFRLKPATVRHCDFLSHIMCVTLQLQLLVQTALGFVVSGIFSLSRFPIQKPAGQMSWISTLNSWSYSGTTLVKQGRWSFKSSKGGKDVLLRFGTHF